MRAPSRSPTSPTRTSQRVPCTWFQSNGTRHDKITHTTFQLYRNRTLPGKTEKTRNISQRPTYDTCQNGRADISQSFATSAFVVFTHSSLASASRRASRRRAAPSAQPPRLAAGPVKVPVPGSVPILATVSDDKPSPTAGPLRLAEGGGVFGRATSSLSRDMSQVSPPPSRNLQNVTRTTISNKGLLRVHTVEGILS